MSAFLTGPEFLEGHEDDAVRLLRDHATCDQRCKEAEARGFAAGVAAATDALEKALMLVENQAVTGIVASLRAHPPIAQTDGPVAPSA